MTIIASQSPSTSALDGGGVKTPQTETLIDLKDIMADTWIERDCLCGTFNTSDRPFVLPAKAIKSRW